MLLIVFLLLSTRPSLCFQQSVSILPQNGALSSSPCSNSRRQLLLYSSIGGTPFADKELVAKENDIAGDDSTTVYNSDVFQSPKTLPLLQSFAHFMRYTMKYWKDKKEVQKKVKKLQRNSIFSKEKVDIVSLSIWKRLVHLQKMAKHLFSLVGYDSSLLIPSGCFLLLGAIFESIKPHYWSTCINYVVSGESRRDIVMQALIGLSISSFLGALFTGLRGALFWIAGTRGNYNVRVKLHRALLRQEAAFFDSTETGELISRLNNDVNKIGMVVSFHVNVVLRQSVQFFIGSAFLIKISPMLSIYAFAGIATVAYVSSIYGAFARRTAVIFQDILVHASAVAETSFSMSETVRAFNGLPVETAKYEDAQMNALNMDETQAWAYGTHKFVSDTLQYALQVALLFSCWALGRAGRIPSVQLTQFLVYANFVLESSNEVGDQWARIQTAIGASSSVFELIRRVPSIRDPDVNSRSADVTVGSLPESIQTQESHPLIHVENLTLTYDGFELPALKDVTLDIRAGDRVAIVGRSGSGKSSLLRILLRFYDPSSGSCSIGGKDLKSMTRKEISKVVSIVQQEPHLFPASLMDNVLYGIEKDCFVRETGEYCYSEFMREKVEMALELAGLSVRGASNDLGLTLDTRVGDGGRTLSGGQRQRVAIARALVRSPEVLLLDEPTAALDSESEKAVVRALQEAMKKSRCMLMVTHRLRVVRDLNVNRVVVMKRGTIAEIGHPEDLLRKEGGLYASLAGEQGVTALKSVRDNLNGDYARKINGDYS
mmetsp:Transcript_22283/g.31922  ORF Transcript_22283/g.31922 Transcript_22283/m.31922 type:complete len:772 (-) Transcript_22283:233-2548(-)